MPRESEDLVVLVEALWNKYTALTKLLRTVRDGTARPDSIPLGPRQHQKRLSADKIRTAVAAYWAKSGEGRRAGRRHGADSAAEAQGAWGADARYAWTGSKGQRRIKSSNR